MIYLISHIYPECVEAVRQKHRIYGPYIVEYENSFPYSYLFIEIEEIYELMQLFPIFEKANRYFNGFILLPIRQNPYYYVPDKDDPNRNKFSDEMEHLLERSDGMIFVYDEYIE